jgi:lipid-binding SYLF domain-containing protein
MRYIRTRAPQSSCRPFIAIRCILVSPALLLRLYGVLVSKTVRSEWQKLQLFIVNAPFALWTIDKKKEGIFLMLKKLMILAASLCMAVQVHASSRQDLQDRIDAAKTVLDQIMRADDKGIPMGILQQATCVGVVPGMIKGAFVFGAQYGQGVVTCRTGHGWSAPVFIRLAGGSWGLQIGGQSTDLVLVAVNEKGFQDLLKSKFKIGANASAAAGPVGRNGEASTDWKMTAELLTYSRTKGLFAGIDLDGTSISQNNPDTDTYYGQEYPFQTILKGSVAVPQDSVAFVQAVAHYFIEAKNQ